MFVFRAQYSNETRFPKPFYFAPVLNTKNFHFRGKRIVDGLEVFLIESIKKIIMNVNSMIKEQERVFSIAKDTFELATIKTTDMLLVISSNKEGLWVLNGNLSPENTIKMLENVTKEYKSNLKKYKNQ